MIDVTASTLLFSFFTIIFLPHIILTLTAHLIGLFKCLNMVHHCVLCRPTSCIPESFHGEAAAGRSLGARQEVKRVLHVEGSDEDFGGFGEGNTRCCRGRENKNS